MPVRINGATSGYVELAAPAVAGTTSVTLPTANLNLGALPLGKLAYATSTSVDTAITTETDLVGMSVTTTLVTGRLYKVSMMLPQVFGSVAGDRIRVSITNSTNAYVAIAYAQVLTYGLPIYIECLVTGSGGATFKGRLSRDVGTGNLSVYADAYSVKNIKVEDMGLA